MSSLHGTITVYNLLFFLVHCVPLLAKQTYYLLVWNKTYIVGASEVYYGVNNLDRKVSAADF